MKKEIQNLIDEDGFLNHEVFEEYQNGLISIAKQQERERIVEVLEDFKSELSPHLSDYNVLDKAINKIKEE